MPIVGSLVRCDHYRVPAEAIEIGIVISASNSAVSVALPTKDGNGILEVELAIKHISPATNGELIQLARLAAA